MSGFALSPVDNQLLKVATQRPSVSQQATRFQRLPSDILVRIFSGERNPLVERVCRAWREDSHKSYRLILKDYLDDPKVKPFVPVAAIPEGATPKHLRNIIDETCFKVRATIEKTRLSTMTNWASTAENNCDDIRNGLLALLAQPAAPFDLRKQVKAIEVLNDIEFFNQVINHVKVLVPPLPEKSRPPGIDHDPFVALAEMKAWMDAHPEILERIEEMTISSRMCPGGLTMLSSAIAKLRNLRVLDLSNNNLETLPPAIGSLEHLVGLYVEGNRLEEIPFEIGRLANLTVLNLKSNQLTALPAAIGSLQKLRVLDLAWNRFTHLPSQICNLGELRVLIASNNQLIDLPPEMRRMNRLEELYLFDNEIDIFPFQICAIRSLQLLNLTGNEIDELPEAIGNLRHLQILLLAENGLSRLPEEVQELQQLKKLDLSDNPFPDFPVEICTLVGLRTLKFLGNNVRWLPLEMQGMVQLERLTIDFNQRVTTFDQETVLWELEVNSNLLEFFVKDCFHVRREDPNTSFYTVETRDDGD